MLIHRQINGDETNELHENALHLAVASMSRYDITPDAVNNLFKIMNILLEYRPSLLNHQSMEGATSLFSAMLSRELQPARFLLERGADENIKRYVDFAPGSETPLEWLVRVGQYPPPLVSLFRRARGIRNVAKLKNGFPRLREGIRLRPQRRLVLKGALDAASECCIPEVLIDLTMEYIPLVESAQK